MNLIRRGALLTAAFCFFISCGIEDFPYLPPISEGWIDREFNDYAQIRIPSGYLDSVYYASGYVIFYRIYSSAISNGSIENLSAINATLASHYRDLETYTDPSKATTLEAGTFRTRGYYELEIEGAKISERVLSKSGGTFTIHFPAVSETPHILLDAAKDPAQTRYPLLRTTNNNTVTPLPLDRYFMNTDELRDRENEKSNIDVAQLTNSSYAYVSMYIAAAGTNQKTFSRIYGKPAFIHVFKLTEIQ